MFKDCETVDTITVGMNRLEAINKYLRKNNIEDTDCLLVDCSHVFLNLCHGSFVLPRITESLKIKGLFTWRKEDPRRRNNSPFSLHAEILVGVATKWRMKGENIARL